MTSASPRLPPDGPGTAAPARGGRWILGLTVAWTALVAGAVVWYGHARLQAHRTDVLRSTEARLTTLHENVDGHFRQVAALAQVLARQPVLPPFLAQAAPPDASHIGMAARAELRQRLMQRPEVLSMSQWLGTVVQDFQIRQALLADLHGTTLADSGYTASAGNMVGASVRGHHYFIDALDEGRGLQYVLGGANHLPGFSFSARVSLEGRPLGVLMLQTDPLAMSRMLRDSARRILLVTDSNGVVVAGSRPADLLRQVPMLPNLAGRERELLAMYNKVPERLAWRTGMLEVAQQEERLLEIDGQAHLMLSRPLAQYPYTVWVGGPLTPWPLLVGPAAAVGLLAALIGYLTLWLLWRRTEHAQIWDAAQQAVLARMRQLPMALFRYEVSPAGNARFTFLGDESASLLGMDEAVLQERPAEAWQRLGPGLGTPPLQPMEFTWEGPAGQRWIATDSRMNLSPRGDQIYDGYWLDVTALRQHQQRFEALFEQVPVGVLLFHRHSGLERCNAAALKMFSAHSFEQLRGRHPFKPPLAPAHQDIDHTSESASAAILQQLEHAREPMHANWVHARLDGTRFNARLALIRLDHESPGLTLAIVEDVTAREQIQESLHKAQQAAQSTDRAKSAFLANMSHEIRTPMNTIMGMTHLAMEDTQPDKHRSYVAKAHQAAKSLLQIVNDILELAKIEAGQLELECIEFSLQSVLDQLTDVLGLQAEQKGLELLFSAPADLPTHLMGDPRRLRQVLLNLATHALKRTSRGSVTLGLEVSSRKGYELVLHGWVRDTGPALSADEQSEIRQALDRRSSHEGAVPPRGGAGFDLGLTICRQLIERMGGQLTLDTTPGQGTTFHFSLNATLPSGPAHAVQIQSHWVGKRALLADDNPDAREVLSRMLIGLGVAVDAVASGPEALAALARSSRPYDWILVDWKMPGMDGIRCAGEIQNQVQQRFPGTQPCVLLVTAFSRDDAVQASRGVSLADVLTKPITPLALSECLRKTLMVRPLVRQAESTATAPAAAPAQPLSGMRILLVEDQPLNQELARELLQLAGASVVCADNGALALTALTRSGPFDCVLMDCQMPVMDGYTATRKMRSQPQWQQLPIIAMTASALASDRAHAMSSGMNDHLTKPLDVQQMYEVIGKWVSAARALRSEAPNGPPTAQAVPTQAG